MLLFFFFGTCASHPFWRKSGRIPARSSCCRESDGKKKASEFTAWRGPARRSLDSGEGKTLSVCFTGGETDNPRYFNPYWIAGGVEINVSLGTPPRPPPPLRSRLRPRRTIIHLLCSSTAATQTTTAMKPPSSAHCVTLRVLLNTPADSRWGKWPACNSRCICKCILFLCKKIFGFEVLRGKTSSGTVANFGRRPRLPSAQTLAPPSSPYANGATHQCCSAHIDIRVPSVSHDSANPSEQQFGC